MRRGAYVVSVIGESPAVLSELLWWLCARERTSLAGIEVWATGRGAERLRAGVAGPAWEALQHLTGPLPMLLSDGTAPDASHGFRVHRFTCEGRVLDDVRTEQESAAVAATLHDRVRNLRTALGAHIDIVGSLAGGRKTVSASLQTAFCLQAGPTDRLVHVLLHAELEARLRAEGCMADFWAPEARWEALSGVPVQEQVQVYDVPFPRIRHLVPRRLGRALNELSWAQVWPVLDANMGLGAVARLERTARLRWAYRVLDPASGQVLYQTRLKARLGAMLAALASTPDDVSAGELVAWLDVNEVGWAPPSGRGHDDQTRERAVRSAVSSLREHLADLPIGLERFGPASTGFALGEGKVEVVG